jgi:hypothetical protein
MNISGYADTESENATFTATGIEPCHIGVVLAAAIAARPALGTWKVELEDDETDEDEDEDEDDED